MKTLTCTQGTDAWHAERAGRFTASEAPAMLGASKYLSRAALLAQKHTGLAPEVSAQQQALFDRGHAAEAAARALLEDELGDLFPVTAVHDEDDRLLASVDGITLDDSTLFEHKLWNERLAQQCAGGELDPHYYWQLEHQLLVTGAERVIFVTSDGTRERWAQLEYRAVSGRREQLLAGWEQFAADLAAYTPPAAAPVVVAAPVQALPAVSVQVTGAIAITDNFRAFEVAVRDFLEHRLIREPRTDQDFADLDVQIKAMKGAEAALESAEAQMLAQIQTVDTAKKTKDMLHKLVRDNRLMAEKLLSSEKERRRGEIVAGGITALRAHVDGWNHKLGKPYMPVISADFAGCIRGMKSLANMEDKIATELARCRGEADRLGAEILVNLTTLRELAKDHAFLFADAATLVLKATDDCRAVIASRIADHRDAEEKRLEAERERIRKEEADRIEWENAERATQEARQAALQRRRDEANAAGSAAMQAISEARQADDLPPKLLDAMEQAASGIITDLTIGRVADSAANVVPLQRPAAPSAAAMPATLNLGTICERFDGDGNFKMTAEFVRRLGIEPAAIDKSAKKFTEAQFQQLCDSLVAHIRTVAHQQQAA